MKKKPNRYDEPLLQSVEAATELLRRVEVQAWVWWFLGTLPFIAALLHFWTDMSRSASAGVRLPQASLMLALAYWWMKVAHSVFSDSLLRHLRGEDAPPPMPLRAKLRFVTSTAMIHCTTISVLVLAFLAMLPFGWAYAFYHNVTVLALSHFRAGGKTRELIRSALNQSHYRVGQNHSLMLVLMVFAAMVWLNVMVGVGQLAMIAHSLTGEENAITRNPVGTMFSSTMLACTIAFSYLVAGPFVKAMYALRCFYGMSRKNGEDLLVAFRRAAVASVVALVCVVATTPAKAEAKNVVEAFLPRVVSQSEGEEGKTGGRNAPATTGSEAPRAGPTIDPSMLGKHIHEVLEQDKFQWRMPRDANAPVDENSGWFGGFFKMVGGWFESAKKALGDVFDVWLKEKIKAWLQGMKLHHDVSDGTPSTPWADVASMAMKAILVVLVAVLAVLLIRQWMKMPPAPAKAEGAVPEINLENEQIIASQLPENEWLRLAQEKMDAGDFRLALRALFLATLSHLGERRMLAIVKSKSNGDYVRELALRARDRTEMRGRFTENVSRFDWAWYGLHDVTRDVLDEFRGNHQLIVSDAQSR